MADQELVTLTIDGSEVSVPKGTTILEAAKRAGVLIPHYCYRPGLPVAGVCLMCLVEIEGAPKLQIACATTVAEGQNVLVHNSNQAKRARQGVLELFLTQVERGTEAELHKPCVKAGSERSKSAEL